MAFKSYRFSHKSTEFKSRSIVCRTNEKTSRLVDLFIIKYKYKYKKKHIKEKILIELFKIPFNSNYIVLIFDVVL